MTGDFQIATLLSQSFEIIWPPETNHVQSFGEIERAEWFTLEQAFAKIIPVQRPFPYRLDPSLRIMVNFRPFSSLASDRHARGRREDHQTLILILRNVLSSFVPQYIALTWSDAMRSIPWRNAVICMVGVWLCFSPWILGYLFSSSMQAAMEIWNLVVSGALVAMLSLVAMITFQRWEAWFEILISVWLVMSPWLLGFQAQPLVTLNLLLSGGIIFVTSIWALSKVGHGKEW
ncbi:hypothetical protein HGP16_27930 [Rhizobium sp. P40RR-XXII]|uniref:SPW repeat domain-containing protein n=1 Tax=Rhizobium sp. P40RR-XXII TaxID=2726739 RepID=UPI00145761A4|nr:SPW repeat protein [Rhizobium sp. P40RR-XXII]NLS20364.1 hypothetical protein [Rhizobium sp. P40RR-XXII]